MDIVPFTYMRLNCSNCALYTSTYADKAQLLRQCTVRILAERITECCTGQSTLVIAVPSCIQQHLVSWAFTQAKLD